MPGKKKPHYARHRKGKKFTDEAALDFLSAAAEGEKPDIEIYTDPMSAADRSSFMSKVSFGILLQKALSGKKRSASMK